MTAWPGLGALTKKINKPTYTHIPDFYKYTYWYLGDVLRVITILQCSRNTAQENVEAFDWTHDNHPQPMLWSTPHKERGHALWNTTTVVACGKPRARPLPAHADGPNMQTTMQKPKKSATPEELPNCKQTPARAKAWSHVGSNTTLQLLSSYQHQTIHTQD